MQHWGGEMDSGLKGMAIGAAGSMLAFTGFLLSVLALVLSLVVPPRPKPMSSSIHDPRIHHRPHHFVEDKKSEVKRDSIESVSDKSHITSSTTPPGSSADLSSPKPPVENPNLPFPSALQPLSTHSTSFDRPPEPISPPQTEPSSRLRSLTSPQHSLRPSTHRHSLPATNTKDPLVPLVQYHSQEAPVSTQPDILAPAAPPACNSLNSSSTPSPPSSFHIPGIKRAWTYRKHKPERSSSTPNSPCVTTSQLPPEDGESSGSGKSHKKLCSLNKSHSGKSVRKTKSSPWNESAERTHPKRHISGHEAQKSPPVAPAPRPRTKPYDFPYYFPEPGSPEASDYVRRIRDEQMRNAKESPLKLSFGGRSSARRDMSLAEAAFAIDRMGDSS